MNGVALRIYWDRVRHEFLPFVRTLPVSLPAALAAFSIVAMFFLVIGQFKTWLVWPVGLVLAGVVLYVVHKSAIRLKTPGSHREKLVVDVLIIAGVVLWTVCNLPFTGQHIFTDRDPATYNLAAVWLTDHDNLHIAKPASLATLAVPGLQADSLGFATNIHRADQLDSQGAHLLPALLGLGGRIVGKSNLLHLNVVFGGLALLALYGFGRLITKPRWAAMTVVVMALSLPMIYFSRDAYTEPLTMVFMFGGLSLLGIAGQTKRRGLWLLTGLTFGAASLARIDAYIPLAGLEVFMVISLLRTKRQDWPLLLKQFGWLGLGTALASVLAWIDVTHLSTLYYSSQRPVIMEEFWLLLGLAIVGTGVLALQYRYDVWHWLDRTTNTWRVRAAWLAIAGFFVILVSRPIWYVGYGQNGARTFSEQTMNWIWWYVGPILMVLGAIGLAWVVTSLLRGRKLELLAFLCVLSPPTLLYLLQPNITGDQPWAVRRLLPVVLPGFVLLGLLVLEKLYKMKRYRVFGQVIDLRVAVSALGAIAVVSPLVMSYPFMIRRLYVPQLSQIESVCQAVPEGATVVWLSDASNFAVQPTRAFCGIDSLGLAVPAAQTAEQLGQTLRTLSANAKNTPLIIGVYHDQLGLLKGTPHNALLTKPSITYADIEHSYKRAPRNTFLTNQTIYLGRLTSDGKLAAL